MIEVVKVTDREGAVISVFTTGAVYCVRVVLPDGTAYRKFERDEDHAGQTFHSLTWCDQPLDEWVCSHYCGMTKMEKQDD